MTPQELQQRLKMMQDGTLDAMIDKNDAHKRIAARKAYHDAVKLNAACMLIEHTTLCLVQTNLSSVVKYNRSSVEFNNRTCIRTALNHILSDEVFVRAYVNLKDETELTLIFDEWMPRTAVEVNTYRRTKQGIKCIGTLRLRTHALNALKLSSVDRYVRIHDVVFSSMVIDP